MKSSGWLSTLCTATLLSGTVLQAQAPSVIEPKVKRQGGPPIWISAEAVADEEKIVDLDVFNNFSLQTYVERQRRELGDRSAEKAEAGEKPSVAAIPASECTNSLYSSSQDHRGGTGSTSTLSDLASNSQSILRGTIRTIDFGFNNDVPASLLGVEISATIKGVTPDALFYILYPIAHFRIGPLHFCNAEKGFEPRLGDQILLFDYVGTVDRDHVLFAPHSSQVFFQSQGGVLFLPDRLRRSPGMGTLRTLDDVIGRLSSYNISSTKPWGMR